MNFVYLILNVVTQSYICKSRATPASTHLDGLSRVFKLNVHMYVGPKIYLFHGNILCKYILSTSFSSFIQWTLIQISLLLLVLQNS